MDLCQELKGFMHELFPKPRTTSMYVHMIAQPVVSIYIYAEDTTVDKVGWPGACSPEPVATYALPVKTPGIYCICVKNLIYIYIYIACM